MGSPIVSLRGGDILSPILDNILDAVVVMEPSGVVTGWNSSAETIFGWSREEAAGRPLEQLIIPVRHREAHCRGLARLAAGQPPTVLNRRIEITGLRKDGSEIPVELAITRTSSDRGEVYIGYLRDVSAQKAVELRLARQASETRLMFDVATMAAEASSFDLALQKTLEAICEISGWPVGHAFLVPELGQRLVSSDIWVERPPGCAAALREAGSDHLWLPGVGLPGRIWQTGEPTWIFDIEAAADFPRKGLGFRSAFGFPLKVNDQTLAILEFFTREPAEPDEHLLLTVRSLGEHVGRVFERKRTEDRRRLLVDELNHRVKNTLAVVQGIVTQTFRSGGPLDEVKAALSRRLDAIAAAHSLLAEERWTKAPILAIIDAAIAGCGADGEGFVIRGRDFNVAPATAVSVALTIHELCTNAYKYGALSNEAGRVEISWTITDDTPPHLKFQWIERGGPRIEAQPGNRGFGSTMLRALALNLGGTATLDFRPEGLRCTILVPVPMSGAGEKLL